MQNTIKDIYKNFGSITDAIQKLFLHMKEIQESQNILQDRIAELHQLTIGKGKKEKNPSD